MSVPRFQPAIFVAFMIICMVAMLPAVTQAQTTNYRFEPDSTYFYSPGGFAPNFSFDISGTFTLTESENFATLTNANFQLSGPESNPSLPLATGEGLADLLENDFIGLVQSTAPNLTSYVGLADGTGVGYTINIDNSSADRLLSLGGSASSDGISPGLDGDSFSFSATAVAVPEPVGLPVCLLLGIALIARRGRGTVPVALP